MECCTVELITSSTSNVQFDFWWNDDLTPVTLILLMTVISLPIKRVEGRFLMLQSRQLLQETHTSFWFSFFCLLGFILSLCHFQVVSEANDTPQTRNESPTTDSPGKIDDFTLEQIITGLRDNEKKIKSLFAKCSVEFREYSIVPGEEPPENAVVADEAVSSVTKTEAKILALPDDRFVSQETQMTILQNVIGNKVARTSRLRHSFDGTDYGTTGFQQDALGNSRRVDTTGNRTRSAILNPFEATILHRDVPVSDVLEKSGGEITTRETIDGHECVVVETPILETLKRSRNDDPFKYRHKRRFYIDPSRNFLVMRREILEPRNGESSWPAHQQVDSAQHEEIQPGLWLPSSIIQRFYNVQDYATPKLFWQQKISVSKWRVNQPVNDEDFQLNPEKSDSTHFNKE